MKQNGFTASAAHHEQSSATEPNNNGAQKIIGNGSKNGGGGGANGRISISSSSGDHSSFTQLLLGLFVPVFDFIRLTPQILSTMTRRRRSFCVKLGLLTVLLVLGVYLLSVFFMPLFVLVQQPRQQSTGSSLFLASGFLSANAIDPGRHADQQINVVVAAASSDNKHNENNIVLSPRKALTATDSGCDEKDKDLCIFREQLLSEEERRLIAMTLLQCSKVLNNLPNTSYFLYGTSLVAWYRHNGSMIPWEDFVNIALFPTVPTLKTAEIVRTFHKRLKTLTQGYSLRFDRGQKIIKCYGTLPSNSRRISSDPTIFWRWPYVEIQIMKSDFSTDSTKKIVKITDPNWEDYSYSSEQIIPVKPVIFEGAAVFVPNDAVAAMEHNYNPYTCRTIYYSHRNETTVDQKKVVTKPCVELRHFVQFSNLEFYEDTNVGLPSCEIGTASDDPLLCVFLPLLTPPEKQVVVDLMRVTITMLEQLKDASYFIYGGTLIGYWRHNGSMIPWDDDVDIAVFRTKPGRNDTFYVDQLNALIKKYPDYGMSYLESQGKVKIFGTTSENSKKIGHGEDYSWRYPFVDVQLMKTDFTEDGQIANVSDVSGFDSYWYPGELILPLNRVQFESMSVLVPKDVDTVLKRNYDIKECTAPYYNHRYERTVSSERQVSRPCVKLTSLYKFTNIFDDYYDLDE